MSIIKIFRQEKVHLDWKNMLLSWLLMIMLLFSGNVFGGFENHLKKPLKKSDIHAMRNIDFIYLINLDQRPEKLKKSLEQLYPYGIYPYRFSAVNGWELTVDAIQNVGLKFEPWMQQGMWGTSYVMQNGKMVPEHEVMHIPGKNYFVHCMGRGTIGIALSHLSILMDAYDAGYKTIWVMEDDIEVLRDPTIIPSLIDKLDQLVGKKGWDILFTDIDFRNRQGEHVACFGYTPRPNFTPKDPSKFAKKEEISPDFRRIGAR